MNAYTQISPTRKQARLVELGQILRERSLTWDERQECKALEAEMRPARLARMFAEMPQMQPQPHDAHVQHWQARNRADEAMRGLVTAFPGTLPRGDLFDRRTR